MSTPGPNEPFGYGTPGAPRLPSRPAADPWAHEHGEDPAHLLDASGHVPQHQERLARLVDEPHVITAADRRMEQVGRVLMAVVLVAAIAAAVWWVMSAT